ncbi:MAG TPA: CopD family protein [Acetobacteraceae bacterium]|jgi:uncharacterized membrane protein|nr:CopD family protein [Acetobacteraceae bacterium]
MIASVLLVLHLLGAVIWVGGMFFALLVLRPSLVVLQPPERLALHGQVFTRFFRVVWHVMPIMLLTGYAMVFAVYGGFANVGWNVNVMNATGLVMSAIFVFIALVPFRALRTAMAAGNAPAAAGAAARIRSLIGVNLLLGLITAAIAGWK